MKIIKKIEKGKKIALAYSGGLDTSVAIKWIKNKGGLVFSYFADLGILKKKEIKKIKKNSFLLGSKKFININCKEILSKEGINLIRYRALNVSCGTGIYFNTTPISRSIIGTLIAKKMKKDDIGILSDGSTYKGNDIERFFRYSYIIDNKIKFYKPWLDKKFIDKIGGRKQMLDFLNGDIKFSNKKNKYSIDSNILGNTYEGGKIENLKFNISDIKFIMCKNIFKSKKKTNIKIEIKYGMPYKINNMKIKSFFLFFKLLNNISSRHNLGISDQVEDRIIGTKSRGIYEAPGMFLLHNVFDRLASCVFDINLLEIYRNNGYYLGKLLYEGKWKEEEAEIRKKISFEITKKINGIVSIVLVGNNIFFKNTYIFKNNKYNIKNSTMEKTKNEHFSYKDRIGYLNIKKLNIDLEYFRKKKL